MLSPDVPRGILVGVRVQANPVGETFVVSETVPANPFWLVTTTVEIAGVLTVVVKLVGFTVTVKSCIVKVTVTV